MLYQEWIRDKRDAKALPEDALQAIAKGLASGDMSDEQAGAFAMAAFLNGLSASEASLFTSALCKTGTVLNWSHIDGPVIDKHSTGGVGDTVSLMLAPMAAACGLYVPMIAGRGLGHTGGTIDKLEAIPGYNVKPDLQTFQSIVKDVGCAIISQTSDFAPADGRLYAIRDVTATVESIPLITASILSKKLAAGLQGLVLDVKTGSGAFMPTFEKSKELAQSLVEVAKGAGLPATACLTDMSQPLASSSGNALEVRYAIDFLTGKTREPRMMEVILALGADMLIMGRQAETKESAIDKLMHSLESGKAAEIFNRMVQAMGGPTDLLQQPEEYLAQAPVRREVFLKEEGYVSSIDVRKIGIVVVELGGGRRRASDTIDPSVGITHLQPIGAKIDKKTPLAIIHAASESDANKAAETLISAYMLTSESVEMPKIIQGRIST
jgi:thymidine phosphorylase